MARFRRRASARRVYAEMLRGLAWARDPGGRPMEDRAWADHRRRYAVGATLYEAVDWAYDTLRDAGPRARTEREAAAIAGIAGRHPELDGLFREGPGDGGGTPDPDLWVWIDQAVPRGLRAAAVEAGLDPHRALRDMTAADGRP